MTDRLDQTCLLCQKETRTEQDETYGNWACCHCGQRHVYEEGHMLDLNDAQRLMLLTARLVEMFPDLRLSLDKP